MRRRTSALLAIVVAVGVLAAPVVGAVVQDGHDEESGEPTVAPGERLSGVVGVQQAELDGELERSAFRIALENADGDAATASHIAETLNVTEERLAALEERKAELDEQRESGEIGEGRYRAEVAELAVATRNAEDRLNQSEAAAEGIPEETLEDNGVNVTAIQTLQDRASELRGGEVAEIARSIAGDDRGQVDRGGAAQAEDRDDRRTDDEQSDADRTDGQQGDDEASTADDDGAAETETGTDRVGSDAGQG